METVRVWRITSAPTIIGDRRYKNTRSLKLRQRRVILMCNGQSQGKKIKMVSTKDIVANGKGINEKPIRHLETAILLCLLSYYNGREQKPELDVRIGDGEVKIICKDFHTGNTAIYCEESKLREYCKNCYILGILKMNYSVAIATEP